MKKFLLLSVCICALPLFPALAADPSNDAAADAADKERALVETPVAERKPVQYAPDGVRMGDFVVYPKAEAIQQFSDNIYATSNSRKNDFSAVLSPSVTVRSDLPQNELNLVVSSDWQRYYHYSSEDTDHYNARATGKLDITHEAWLTGDVSYDYGYEPRSSPDPVLGRTPTIVTTKNAILGAEYRPSQLWIKADAGFQRLDFSDVFTSAGSLIDNYLRNRDVYSGGVRVAYELIPNYYAFFESRGNFRVYDNNNALGISRNSNGFEERAGTDIEISGKLRGDVYVGYLQQDFDSSTYGTVQGVAMGAGLKWSPTGLTTVKLQASRTVEDTTDLDASSYLATRVRLTVDHELLRNIIVSMDGGYELDNYQGDSSVNNIFDGGGKVLYKLNKVLYTGFALHQFQHMSTVEGQTYHESRGILTLGAQY